MKPKNTLGFEDLMREKLSGYELDYNHADWVKFEKSLGNAPGAGFSITKIFTIASIVIGAAAISFIAYKLIASDSKGNNSELITQIERVPANIIPVDDAKVSKAVENKPVATKAHVTVTLGNNDCEKQESALVQVQSEPNVLITTASNNLKSQPGNVLSSKQPHDTSTPEVKFTVDAIEGCTPLKVTFLPTVKSDSLAYLWNFGDGTYSSEIKPNHTYLTEGTFPVTLTVKSKKGGYSTTYTLGEQILVKLSPKADFTWEKDNYKYTFINKSVNYSKLLWNINGEESSADVAEMNFMKNAQVPVKLVTTAANGCIDVLDKNLQIEIQFNVHIPKTFSPNGDGVNDEFQIFGVGLEDCQVHMLIYNRYGKLICELKNSYEKWDGRIAGTNQIAEEGVYAYILTIKDKFGNKEEKHGTINLK